ncbi:MAG: potassium transporter TrkG, partial [Rhodothermales bacterium]
NGLFMSVTARTSGFNSVDYANVSNGANFFTILLMSVGGSPGSTAGGIKTTTAAIIALVAFSRLRGYKITMVAGRSIPEETVQRSIGLFVLAFGVVTAAIFLFSIGEISWVAHEESGGSFLKYMFEAVSAFNTVGLSMGATNELSGTGKFLTTLLMFLGRVGPLTFAAALARRYTVGGGKFYYAYEDVAIG